MLNNYNNKEQAKQKFSLKFFSWGKKVSEKSETLLGKQLLIGRVSHSFSQGGRKTRIEIVIIKQAQERF